jgi:hypothetical protein
MGIRKIIAERYWFCKCGWYGTLNQLIPRVIGTDAIRDLKYTCGRCGRFGLFEERLIFLQKPKVICDKCGTLVFIRNGFYMCVNHGVVGEVKEV